mgnify:CR=1 FL=1
MSPKTDFRPFIYGLVDPADPGHVRYVGMSRANARRPFNHAKDALKGRHVNAYLSNWILKIQTDGREPKPLVLEEFAQGTSGRFIGLIETYYIKALRDLGHKLTNITLGGEGWGIPSAEKRKKNSDYMKKYRAEHPMKWTDERRATHSAFMKGKKYALGIVQSAETRAKKSASQMGHAVSAETNAKKSKALKGRLVHPVTNEMRSGTSVRAKGNKYSLSVVHSTETREKMRESRKRWLEKPENRASLKASHTPESRAAIGAANRGRICTAEQRAKLSAANRARFEKRKAAGLAAIPPTKEELARKAREYRAKKKAEQVAVQPWSQSSLFNDGALGG